MLLPLSTSPVWIRAAAVAAVAALAWFAAAVASGWWPKTTREWRFFGFTLVAFTAVFVVAICVFHYA